MDIEARVAALERRLAALESGEAPGPTAAADATVRSPSAPDTALWALEGLKERLGEDLAEDGGVLFAGAVRLPTDERYEWQHSVAASALVEQDDREWTASAEALSALGHPVRIRLLAEIMGGRRTAAALTALDSLGTTGQVYHHLRQLTSGGWLHTVGRGHYEVPPGRVIPLLVVLAATRA